MIAIIDQHLETGATIALFLYILRKNMAMALKVFMKALLLTLKFSFIALLNTQANAALATELGANELRDLTHAFVSAKLLPLAEKKHRYDMEIGNLSPSLKLRQCSDDIQFELKRDVYQSPNNTIEAQCVSPSWKLYIPITIDIYGPIVISKTSIPKNTLIRAHHLELKEQQINLTRYANYNAIKLVQGMRAKRNIRQGAVISPSSLEPPMLVARGDQVIISAESEVIAIQMKGEALNSGALGEQISVKNLSSDRIIRARVTERGKVSVLL